MKEGKASIQAAQKTGAIQIISVVVWRDDENTKSIMTGPRGGGIKMPKNYATIRDARKKW